MDKYEKVIQICKSLGLRVVFMERDNVELCGNCLNIPESIRGMSDDNNLFYILWGAGYSRFNDKSVYERERKSVVWAIQKAETCSLLISYATTCIVQDSLDELNQGKYKYDFSRICYQQPLGKIINEYGFPIALTRPNYWGGFYFIAESFSDNGRVTGTAYKNGIEYTQKKYSYSVNEIFEPLVDNFDKKIKETIDNDRTYNQSIKKRIKEDDTFDEYDTDLSFLYNHQRAGCLLARRYDRFAFFYDTGTGKTIMTLAAINEKARKTNAKFMIVAPKAIIKSAWMEDASDWFPSMRILPLSNNFSLEDYCELYKKWSKNSKIPESCMISNKDWKSIIEYCTNIAEVNDSLEKLWREIYLKMFRMAQHYIINIEKFRYDVEQYLDSYSTDGLVVDESAILKNPTSKSAQTILKIADHYKYIYLLSGKPAPNNGTEYYVQMKIVDPETFNMTFRQYRSQYFIGNSGNSSFIDPVAESTVADMIANRSIIVSKEDCLRLPEVCHKTVKVKLSSEVMEQYKEMLKGCFGTIIQQERKNRNKHIFYSTSSKLAIMTKLREMASGFFLDEYSIPIEIHNGKIKALIKIINDNPFEQILIWCQFTYEIEMLEKLLATYGKTVTAYGKSKDIDKSILEFKNGTAKFILAHPKSIKYGITFTNCHLAVYYSMSYSAEDYYQSRDRIYRLGQKRNCEYFYLIAKDTVDEIMFDCVKEKMSYAEIFQEIIKSAAKHGINYDEFKAKPYITKRERSEASRLVEEKYAFRITEDGEFECKYNEINMYAPLFNKMLNFEEILFPEEMLFEIGNAIMLSDIEKKVERNVNRKVELIKYENIEQVNKWVVNEFKNLKIKLIDRAKDYLAEQLDKQYEIDIARGFKDERIAVR